MEILERRELEDISYFYKWAWKPAHVLGLSLCWSIKRTDPKKYSYRTKLLFTFLPNFCTVWEDPKSTAKTLRNGLRFKQVTQIQTYSWISYVRKRLKTAEQRFWQLKKHWDYGLQKARHNLSSEPNWSEGLLKQICLSREDSWQAKPHGPSLTPCQSG